MTKGHGVYLTEQLLLPGESPWQCDIIVNDNCSPPISLQQRSLRQRVSSLVMKTLADNTEKDRSIQTAQTGDIWKVKVLQQTRTIVNVRESLQIVADIMHPKRPSPDGKIVIGVDCEGINLGAKGKLTLLQISTVQGQVYLFDAFTSPDLIMRGGLKSLLESETVIKVLDNRSSIFPIIFSLVFH